MVASRWFTFCIYSLLLLAACLPWRSLTHAAHISESDTVVENDENDVGVIRIVWNWFMDNVRSVVNSVDAVDLTTNVNPNNNDAVMNAVEVLQNNATTVERSAGNEGRTFGKIRRLQMALIPIVFKFGVISAMVTFLVMLGLKSLFLLKLLVLMNTVAIIGKFLTFKADLLPHAQQPVVSWNPYVQQGWAPTAPAAPSSKEIHLHLHGLQAQSPHGETTYSYGPPSGSQMWNRRNTEPYSSQYYNNFNAYAPVDQQTELTNTDGLNAQDGTKQEYLPKNHRNF